MGIRSAFPQREKIIRPGQFARVRGIVEERPAAVLVPRRRSVSWTSRGRRSSSWSAPTTKVVLKPVTLDERIDESTTGIS